MCKTREAALEAWQGYLLNAAMMRDSSLLDLAQVVDNDGAFTSNFKIHNGHFTGNVRANRIGLNNSIHAVRWEFAPISL
jgi:hypothetical protein